MPPIKHRNLMPSFDRITLSPTSGSPDQQAGQAVCAADRGASAGGGGAPAAPPGGHLSGALPQQGRAGRPPALRPDQGQADPGRPRDRREDEKGRGAAGGSQSVHDQDVTPWVGRRPPRVSGAICRPR